MNEPAITPWPATLENIRSVLDWQQAGFVHPLTCGDPDCREDLLPSLGGLPGRSPHLLLLCPKCGRQQVHIPGCVISGPRERAFTYTKEALGGKVAPKFKWGDRVRKTKGSSWQGHVVGTYATTLTPEGYAVESEREPGSVQIYPASALELVPA